MVKKWEQPKILSVDNLPEALGHCFEGWTEVSLACAYGDYTGLPPHPCIDGGIAGDLTSCIVGGQVITAPV